MKKIFLFIALIGLCISACNKYHTSRNDIGGDYYLRGRLVMIDDVNGDNVERPAPNITISIGVKDQNKVSYTITDTTDADGYFVFEHLKEGHYLLYAESAELNDSILYMFDEDDYYLTNNVSDSKFTLTPAQEKQNGAVYIVQDTTGSPVPDCTLYVFANRGMANDSGKGATYTLHTSTNGRAVRLNIPAGIYTTYASIDVNNIHYTAISLNDTIKPEGFKYKTLKLQPVPAPNPKGITFIVKDEFNGVVEDCQICIFTSKILANDSCAGSTISGNSDRYGKLILSNIPEGDLYIFFSFQKDTAKLKGKCTINNYKEDKMYLIDTVRVR
jgi:hypothetical protein